MAFEVEIPCRKRTRHPNWQGALVLVVAFAAGCRESTPPGADPGKARGGLEAALDAWKSGETSETLRARSPAIFFNEPNCAAGNRLIAYEIESEERSGFNWRCVVSLTVQSGDGKPKQRRVKYLIDTDPALVIVQDP